MATEDEARAAVARLSRELQDRRPHIERRIDYFKGREGRLRFASDEFRDYFKKRFEGFSDNWCMPVAQSPAERMNPLGIRLEAESRRADLDLQRVWLASDADRDASEAFQVFVVAARAFALVAPNPRDATTPRITFEHPAQAIVEYDPATRESRYGMTVWTDDKWDYATLYTRREVWKYQRQTGLDRDPARPDRPTPLSVDWVPREVQGETWPAPNPLGAVPLVELRNQSLLDDEPMSDIGGVMAMQDSINLVWAYLLNALDYASLPQRVVLKSDVPKVPILDETGNVVGSRPVELDELLRERIMFLPGKDATIGEWTAAQLDSYSRVIEQAVEHIAAQTRTPPHYLVAKLVNTSAESLTVAEAGLVSKTLERITYVNPALRQVYRLVALAQGDDAKARAAAAGEIMWRDVQYRSEAQRADALAKKKAIGYPLEYLLELDGVPPWDIPRILEMARRERTDPTMERIARDLSGSGAPGGR
ncbi:phage portal protein [Micromonospora deserti]|uniref:Phage portal protein n=1 Tax=Micromonospora deserti TaxID=2070366 RepID=A0A2W2DBN7_9ACTN|nr:phage portal protein [Micromonospora deserti]PZF98249.1 hypothetical protein C1I99_13770 [Micromonospora deserti]